MARRIGHLAEPSDHGFVPVVVEQVPKKRQVQIVILDDEDVLRALPARCRA